MDGIRNESIRATAVAVVDVLEINLCNVLRFLVGRDSYRTGRQFASKSIDLLCTLVYAVDSY